MHSRNRYDVFISYKRKGGTPWAELLYLALTRISKKKVYIDWEGIKSGTTETWKHNIFKAISMSNNIVVPIFSGIQDVITDTEDNFLWEISIAIQGNVNIIPLYVDGLSSTDIEKSEYYDNLPDSLKAITSSAHDDLKYIPGGFNIWYKKLIRSLITTTEVYQKNQYKVEVEAVYETEVYDEDELDSPEKIKKVDFGKQATYWLCKDNAILVLRFKHVDSEGRSKVYTIILDTINTEYCRPDRIQACYRIKCKENQTNALFRINNDGTIKIFMDWRQIDQFVINESIETRNDLNRPIRPNLNFVDNPILNVYYE